ncbi:MAG: hypothetical protein L0Z50_33440, partial [Verrucomicrobiales bacterium]|nr:hypothetical protein [Verrucomicrobiales bacterium]
MQTESLSAPGFRHLCLALSLFISTHAAAQTLIDVDFGAGSTSAKTGFAATGQGTNDFWNRYRHYQPKFVPGMPLVANGRLENLKFADGSPSQSTVAVTNAPGVWGNATGDPMFDSYVFAPNGSNIVVTLTGLEAGRYHFYLYGHADADVSAEQNSLFTLRSGTNFFGPVGAAGMAGGPAGQPWRERGNYIVFRDVPVMTNGPVMIEVLPGPGGIAVLNGLQILSRGTAPPRLSLPDAPMVVGAITNLLIREVRYDGKLSTNGARFTVAIDAESRSTNEVSAVLFAGDVAVFSPKLPTGWRLVAEAHKFRLFAAVPGAHRLEMQLAAKVQHAEPWNHVAFIGPPGAIATVSAEADLSDADVQLESGTPLAGDRPNQAIVRGVLGADQRVALRWQGKATEVKREALVAVDSQSSVTISPAVTRYLSRFRYEILQGRVSALRLYVPADHALTRLEGEQVRDWHIKSDGAQQLLTVEFIRPLENSVTLALTTEQSAATLPAMVDFVPPAPIGVQRESGAFSLRTEDVVARVETARGMRQVNAAESESVAFRFHGRPASLRAQITRLEPVITVLARVSASLEESRLLLRHDLRVNAAKAGIYSLEMIPQPGFSIAEVNGLGVEDWKAADGRLHVSFGRRVLGDHKLTIQLERALTNTPPEIIVEPLRISGAAQETAFIGAGSTPGLQVKTAALDGVREIPITALPERKDELLAFRAEQGNWRVRLAAERLAPRLVAEIFNLLTIGDGVVGGSATVRYGIVNQGVQQFRVRLPSHWRNVEFTGPNLRRKDKQDDLWTISLQDKAWDGYTIVVTYDFAFDPNKATLNAAGAHALEVERESGTLAVTTAAGLTIEPGPVTEPLRLIDPAELSASDRALITRPVLQAFQYEGTNFALALNVTRHAEVQVLDAIADRAQLTSVLTESGEMLTQASFMVKNSQRQFQRFQLPRGATLWGVTVNGE